MQDGINRKITEETKLRAKAMLGADLPRRSRAPEPRLREYRFGQGMMLAALLCAIVGIYPLPTDLSTRLIFLFFAIVMALIGAFYIDRSNKTDRWERRLATKGEDERASGTDS